MFYIAMTQQVLLLRAESGVLTGKMEAALDAFQGRVARRLTGRLPRRGRDGKWQYLPLAGATKDAGIVRARTSVLQRQNTVAQFVAMRPILVLCEGTERRGGTRFPQRWWEQTGIESQNRPRCNKLRDRILYPEDRCSRPHDPCVLYCSRQGEVLPLPVPPLAWKSPCQPPSDPALEGVQGRFHLPRQYPGLRPKRRTCCVTAI